MALTPWWLLGLAALGAGLSLYFALAYYGRVETRGIPQVLCRRQERDCLTILQTPYARLFGLPNAVLGLVFYALTAAVAGLAVVAGLPRWLWGLDVLGAAATVLLAPYLIWALVARLRTWCWL